MRRAGQTPHGARPNREGAWLRSSACRLGAPQPPGRSLEPRSNAWPRGMTVPSQDGQNSAYRSGCHKLCSGERSLGFARDFGSGLPLLSRPLSASTYRSGCHLYRLLGILRFAQDFGSALPLRSRPLSASTYRSGRLLHVPIVPMSVKAPVALSMVYIETLFEPEFVT
jgi:hypothetical protein